MFPVISEHQRKTPDPDVPVVPWLDGDVEHTIFSCASYAAERVALTEHLGRPPRPEDMGNVLVGNAVADYIENRALREYLKNGEERCRKTFIEMVANILQDKEEDERRRQKEEREAATARRTRGRGEGSGARRRTPGRPN